MTGMPAALSIAAPSRNVPGKGGSTTTAMPLFPSSLMARHGPSGLTLIRASGRKSWDRNFERLNVAVGFAASPFCSTAACHSNRALGSVLEEARGVLVLLSRASGASLWKVEVTNDGRSVRSTLKPSVLRRSIAGVGTAATLLLRERSAIKLSYGIPSPS